MDRPNVVVFMTDDHARWAAGCYGMEGIHSPTMDWLARTGLRMDQACTTSPVCSPARASFWTGKIPSAHGIHDYIHESGLGKDHPGILGQENLGMCLQRAGYYTSLIGKWHCHHFEQPMDGFDRWFTHADGTNARFGRQRFYDQDQLAERHGHQAPTFTDEAVKTLLNRPEGHPFFMFVGYTDTHTPHRFAPQRLLDVYADEDFDQVPLEPITGTHGYARIRQTTDPEQRRAELADYFASVSAIDEQVGRVIDELESQGILDNTLIVYTADHGHMNGHHGLHSKGNATIPQNLLDESIGVPSIWRWPGVIEENMTSNACFDHCDLYATVLDVAGASSADGIARPGRSLLELINTPTDWRDAQFSEYGNARMIRTSTWKYIRRFPGEGGDWPDELYDLVNDPREEINVIGEAKHGEVLAELRGRLDAYFDRYEVEEHSGKDMASQPATSDWAPWGLTPQQCHEKMGREGVAD